jgi:hypothetical protein
MQAQCDQEPDPLVMPAQGQPGCWSPLPSCPFLPPSHVGNENFLQNKHFCYQSDTQGTANLGCKGHFCVEKDTCFL